MSVLKTLDVVQSNALLEQLLQTSGTYIQKLKGLRNYLIGLLMLDAGLRVGEVVSLLCTDLWFHDEPVHSLCVRKEIAKRQRERIIPLTGRIQRAIKGIANNDRTWQTSAHSLWMFCEPNAALPLSRRQVQRFIKRAGMVAFNESIHPHVLRHTFATKLMLTCSIRVVQELLGHKNLSSTQVYTHPNHVDLKNAIANIDEKPLTAPLTG